MDVARKKVSAPQVSKAETATKPSGVSTPVVKVPPSSSFGAPAGSSAQRLEGHSASHAVQSQRFSYGEKESWNITGKLPASASAKLSAAEKTMIAEVVNQLRESVQQSGRSFVPVFGYLSLRKDNFRELGLGSQAEVQAGVHTVEAQLEGHDIDVVASTIYRGTPEHPGVVAGLGAAEGRSTPGTVLKLPLERAEELLAGIFHREYFAEDDLDGSKPQAMYKPVLREVKTETGETMKALVFVTNDDSLKAVNRNGVLGSEKLSVEQMAWFMGARGGFEGLTGCRLGGASRTYWENSYLAPRKATQSPVDPVIGKAIELSKLVPSPECSDYLAKHALTDEKAMRALEVVLTLFQGAALPLGLKQQQRAEQALKRSVEPQAVDVQAEVNRYLALADQVLG